MVATSRLDSLAARCAIYIEELRDLFLRRNLPCGEPEDIVLFADRLSDPAFLDEMGSMLRSVLYREETSLSRSEVLEMLALAAGGAQFDNAALDLHEPLRRILAFATSVLSQQRRGFAMPETTTVASAPVEQPGASLELLTEPASEVLSTDALAPARRVGPESQIRDAEQVPWEKTRTGYPAAHEDLHTPVTPVPEQSACAGSMLPQRRTPRPTLLSILQRNYWLPGLLALLVAVAAVLFFTHHATMRTSLSATIPARFAASPGRLPKPSAYGSALITGAAPIVVTGRPRTHTVQPPPAAQQRDVATASSVPLATSPSEIVKSLKPDRIRSGKAHAVVHQALVKPLPPNPDEAVFLSSSGAMASHLLFAPAPHYPGLASFAHVQGQVIVQVVVGPGGAVDATRVLEGPMLLRGAAEKAIRHWRYRPYLMEGKATNVATIVTVSFRLHR